MKMARIFWRILKILKPFRKFPKLNKNFGNFQKFSNFSTRKIWKISPNGPHFEVAAFSKGGDRSPKWGPFGGTPHLNFKIFLRKILKFPPDWTSFLGRAFLRRRGRSPKRRPVGGVRASSAAEIAAFQKRWFGSLRDAQSGFGGRRPSNQPRNHLLKIFGHFWLCGPTWSTTYCTNFKLLLQINLSKSWYLSVVCLKLYK